MRIFDDETGWWPVKSAIVSQLLSSLSMLQEAMDSCPDDLWDGADYENKYWHIVYHTLFYTDLYLSPSEGEFRFWHKAREGYQFMGRPRPGDDALQSYSKDELNEYLAALVEGVPGRVREDDLEAESGFYWQPIRRGELHLYNIRHVQHHTGQLVERLRSRGIAGHKWVKQVEAARWGGGG